MGASAAGAYEIERSVRFNSAETAVKLTRTFSGGTTTKYTLSVWVKRTKFGATQPICGYYTADTTSQNPIRFNSSDQLEWYNYTGGYQGQLVTNRKFRDCASWYHLVFVWDTANSTAGDRMKIYVNGTEETSFATDSNPSQDQASHWNSNNEMTIGTTTNYNDGWFDGYMAEMHFIDNAVKTASDFGKTDPTTGAWIPKAYGGSHGTTGFYMSFADNSSTANMFVDDSANSNDWTHHNMSNAAGVGCDSVEDTPTNNFCTLNSNFTNGTETGGTLSDGNLRFGADNNYAICQGTHSLRYDKYYWEVTITSAPSSVVPQGHGITRGTNTGENSYVAYDPNGNVYGLGWWWSGPLKGAVPGGSTNGANHGTTIATFGINDVIGFASDIPNGTLKFYKDGSLEHTMTGIGDHDWFPTVGGYNLQHCYVNFGQRAFTHTIPTGYKTLCSANIPEPTIKDGTKHFDHVLYTGNGGSSQTITGLDFQPDLTWFKARTTAGADQNWMAFDSVRGVEESLWPNGTWAEDSYSGEGVSAFNSNGVTIGDSGNLNVNNDTYVMLAWKESATAGFDIVSYEGDGSGPRTISHNLGEKPHLIICKNRDQVTNWMTYHHKAGAEKFLYINTANAQMDDAAAWNDTEPTSSVFTVNADQMNNGNGDDIIAYVFSSVEGFSKFGEYTGNGNANGPFVYTGFRPALLAIKGKSTATSMNWMDTARNPSNPMTQYLNTDGNGDEGNYAGWDVYSNGFKLRNTGGSLNTSGQSYVYLAFAETSFKYANAR